MLDLCVIGAGPAGVSAALYAKSRGLDVTVFEQAKVGGLIGQASLVSHFAGAVVGESGPELAVRFEKQLLAAQIPIHYEKVDCLKKQDNSFSLKTIKGNYEARQVIVATGSTPKELPLDLPANTSVLHWALGQKEAVRDRIVVVNGGSDGAAKEALYLAQTAREVHIVQDQPQLLCIAEFRQQIEAAPHIFVHCGKTVSHLDANGGKILSCTLTGADGKTEKLEAADGLHLFAMIGQAANSDLLADLLPLENGFVRPDRSDHGVTTAIPGLYVAGDIRVKAVRQVATAVQDGCLAGIAAAAKTN